MPSKRMLTKQTSRLSKITRKGQITIPSEFRDTLNIKEGDTMAWVLKDEKLNLEKSKSAVERTAGILKYKGKALTAEQEREAAGQAMADEFIERSDS